MTYRKLNILTVTVFILMIVFDWQAHVPFSFYVALVLIYLIINFWGTIFISSNFFILTKCKAAKVTDSIAITFDDGPVPEHTDQVLSILKEHNVKATFFCIGKNVKEHPALTLQIHQDGHLIGNHSYDHGSFFDLQSSKKMRGELRETNDAINKTIGLLPRFFRPPYGVTNPMLVKAIVRMNFVTVGWSIRSFDTTAKKKEKLLARITQRLRAGDIILLHDRCKITAEILPDLLNYIRSIGLRVEPLDKLLEEQAYV